MNETKASTLQKLLASRTKTDEAQPKATPPKEATSKATPPKEAPPKEALPKATPPKEAPLKASPAKAAPPKPTLAKETSKQIPIPPNMSPDNLSVDLCWQENCSKGASYKAANKLKKKLFANDSNTNTITDDENDIENQVSHSGAGQTEPCVSIAGDITDAGQKHLTPVKTSGPDGGNNIKMKTQLL